MLFCSANVTNNLIKCLRDQNIHTGVNSITDHDPFSSCQHCPSLPEQEIIYNQFLTPLLPGHCHVRTGDHPCAGGGGGYSLVLFGADGKVESGGEDVAEEAPLDSPVTTSTTTAGETNQID